MIRFTILGELVSKANSRKATRWGGFIKSDKARRYAETIRSQVPAEAKAMLEGELRMTVHAYYASERPDLDVSLLLDGLQAVYKRIGKRRVLIERGCYHNDRQVRELHLYHGIDRLNPRAEVEIDKR